jgi:hypothetical protein
MVGPSYDEEAFAALQKRLIPLWPEMTLRTTHGAPRTIFVISSVSIELPAHYVPLITAYEERYLCLVLLLAKARNTRVVYVTSQPVLPRLVDYYLSLIPGLDREELRRRLTVVSVGDASFRPLTEKILERPRLLQRLRDLIAPDERALVLPFMTTPLEARLALALDAPVYGPDPRLRHLGTKTGSRQVFRASGIDLPIGVEGVRTPNELVEAVWEVHSRSGARSVMVKCDEAVSGLGNAVIDLGPDPTRDDVEPALLSLAPEDSHLSPQRYLGLFERSGGIVEERLTGAMVRSPSVQLRASPLGEVEVLSTHDQVLGGTHGQTYQGCRFPADESYAAAMVAPGIAVAEELASRGVIGRFAVDFVATSDDGSAWRLSAVEINLRNGGTTHPNLTLQALTDASYEPEQGRLVSRGRSKRYLATDHLQHPRLSALTPDDLLDVVDDAGLGWDEETHTGVAFHMASAIAVAGHVGLTAIGDSHRQAQWLYDAAKHSLITAATDGGQEL